MQSFHLGLFNRGIDAERLDGALFFILKPIYADNHGFVSLDFFLAFISRVLDLALNVTQLNRVQRAADSVNLVEVVDNALLDLSRQFLNHLQASQRTGGVSATHYPVS